MLDLGDFVPGEPGRVFNRLLERGVRRAACHDIQIVAVTPVFGHPPLIGRQQNRPRCRSKTFNLDEAKLTGTDIQTCDIISKVLLVDIVDLPA